MDDLSRTGVSLTALRELAGRVDAGVGEGATTAAVVENIIRPATLSQLCSYVELLRDEDRGVPTTVVIAPWTLGFNTLVDVVMQEQIPNKGDSVYVWLDVLACNLHTTEDDRLDAVSHAATVVSSAPSHTETDGADLAGPPAPALEAYRQAIRTVTSSCPEATTGGAPSGALLVVLDGDATLLTSPWCLYGIWSYMHHQRAEVAAGQLSSIIPFCVGPLDVLLAHLAWENLSLLSASPHTVDSLHNLILEEVTAEESIRLPSSASAALDASKSAAAIDSGAMAQKGVVSGADGNDKAVEDEQGVEARVAAADAAIKFCLLTAFDKRIKSLSAVSEAIDASAAKSVEPVAPQPTTKEGAAAVSAAAVQPAAQTETTDAEGDSTAAGKEEKEEASSPQPPPESTATVAEKAGAGLDTAASVTPGSTPATASVVHIRSLAAASDVFGCLLWAAGRPEEGEAHLRRAHELHAGLPQPQPMLPLTSLLHLGALLHVLPQHLDSDEAELLLRGAIARLDAAHNAAYIGAAAASTTAALLSAQARHFLARLLCLRAAVGSNPSASSAKNASPNGRSGSDRPGAAVPPPHAGSAMGGTLNFASSMLLPPGGAPEEVSPLLHAALPAFQAHYGGDHPLTATLLSNLALTLKDQGQLDEAEQLLRRALAAREAFHGPSHVDTMRCMNNLAGLLEAQGKLDEAEALLRKSAELAASSLGPSHAYTANALSNLGVALRKAGKLDEAEELFKAALEIREKLLGPLALDTAASLGDMTILMLDQERLVEAEPLFRRILDIRELVLGPDHRDTAAALCDLATLLAQMDRPVDAEPLLRRAVAVHVRCLGPGHEDTASTTRELGKVLAQQGQVEEAEKLFRRALTIMESVLGTNHPETVTTVNHLAVLLKETAQSTEAEALFQRVLSLTDSLDLDTSSKVSPAAQTDRRRLRAAAMIAMRGLAELAGAAGRLEEAEVLSCRALVASERALGPVHPVTLTCAEGLGEVLQQLDLLEDAGELYARLVETLAEEHGMNSEHVVRYLGLYEAVYTQMLEHEQQQQQLQEQQPPEDEDKREEDAGDADEKDEAAESEAAVTTGKHVRIARGAGNGDGAAAARSAESVGSIMSTLLGPLGRSITMKRRAAASKRQQSRGSTPSAGSGDDHDGHGNGSDAGPGGLRHSFASFVRRRGQQQQQQQQQGSGQQRSSSRAQSVVGRVHSSLVAAGRLGPGGPLGDARKERQAASSAAVSGGGGGAGGSAVNGDGGDSSCVSPGLPLRDQAEDAAAGAAAVSLDAPRPYYTGNGSAPEELYEPTTMPMITASAFGYGSVTAGLGGSRSISRRQPGAGGHRRSSVDAIDVRRSVGASSMISIGGGISKKALLQQADIDLDDEEDEDAYGADRGPRKSLPDTGRMSRRGGSAPTGAAAAAAATEDEEYEDTSDVGCCVFGGSAKRKVRPVTGRVSQ